MKLGESVTVLWGVGEQRAKALEKLGIYTLEDLLLHYPRDYIDLTSPRNIIDAIPGEICAVRASVFHKMGETIVKGGMRLYKAQVGDSEGIMNIVFFNNPYSMDRLHTDDEALFYGKIERTSQGRVMYNPQVFSPDIKGFWPIYPLTKNISNGIMRHLIQLALPTAEQIPEILPETIREEYQLMDGAQAIQTAHAPENFQSLSQARRRLMFEELFVLAVSLEMLRTYAHDTKGIPMEPHSLEPFYQSLPFALTGAQQRAIQELSADMCRDTPANRLVQGDVGSGKTMVAAAGAYFAFLSGTQSAMMAPTELLAQQHYTGLSALLGKLGMRLGLLTGSMSAAQKRKIRQALADGEIDLCIGTHALLSEGVGFAKLGLVITDEQHRFGVAQRAGLSRKGNHPHTLVMSATPIPRTLALMIYGELDLSIIDELPPGRKPIKTYKISPPKRERAFRFIREHLMQGRQAYIVCPLVEAADGTPPGLRDAVAYLETIKPAFTGFHLGLLHGKMRPAEKEHIMSAFSAGKIQLLVSTTVIEVGVDVPNATIMMVENAERFGLSQLHQLRGRVGRGTGESFCILLSDSRNMGTLERLKMLCDTNDGFRIAEYDLASRGPGNFLGWQQHGLPQLRIADLTTDRELVSQAQQAAHKVLEKDPLLCSPENKALRKQMEKMMDSVGGRPN